MLGSWRNHLCLCNWVEEKHPGRVDRRLQTLLEARYEERTSDIIQEASRQLDEYFGRKRTAFDLPLLFTGTDFQKKVWQKLLEIPTGKSCLTATWQRSSECPSPYARSQRQRGERHLHHRPLPSGGRQRPHAYRIWRRLAAKSFLLELEKSSLSTSFLSLAQ